MDEGEDGGGSFEERLRAARRRQGLAPRLADQSGGAGGNGPSALGIGLRVGVELVSALAVAVAIGWWLDKWLHTSPALLAVFVLLGGAAGVANVWRLVGPGREAAGPDSAGRNAERTDHRRDGPVGKGRDSGC
jgi:ATP synthase protein I